jgi:hypothetical protein
MVSAVGRNLLPGDQINPILPELKRRRSAASGMAVAMVAR